MRPHPALSLTTLLLLASAPPAVAQVGTLTYEPIDCPPGTAQTEIEFIAPMPGEEIPHFHTPEFDSWHVILEISTEQLPGVEVTRVFESLSMPSPGAAVPFVTDVNSNGTPGDRHPAFRGLMVFLDDDILHMPSGVVLPAGTNLSSLFEMIGSEIEHGGDQSITVSWLVDPTWMLIDANGDMGTTLFATLNGVGDFVFARHGWDPVYMGFQSTQNPTISIWTEDWLSTVDSETLSDRQTPFLVGVEVRIPCYFDGSTSPPTPVPLDPVFGPCQGGAMACTGFFPPVAGPGFHPMFPSLDLRFSDDYTDAGGTAVAGGVITGGQCGVIWGSTRSSLAYNFQQASVHAWYGANGFPDTTPLGGGDDQLIYRFTMLADGVISDTDSMPGEMLITAAVETSSNCFSITNVRVKHRPDVETPNPR